MEMKWILLIERNLRSGWAIYGELGVKQYYGYTKQEAIRMYQDEAERTVFVNQPRKRKEAPG